MKMMLVVIALSFAPGLALAQGCIHQDATKITASSCAAGLVFDAEKRVCVPLATS